MPDDCSTPPHDAAAIRWWRRALAEFIGTFFLVVVSAGSEVAAVLRPAGTDPLAVAAAPGLLVMAMIYSVGHVSGAHFNPVVTLAFAARRSFPARWAGLYLAAQVIAAASAALLLRQLFGRASPAAEAPGQRPIDSTAILAMEAVTTCLLLLVVLHTAHEHALVGTQAALAVGGAITACRLLGARLAATSMNPLSAWGSAITTGRPNPYWLHLSGPLLGGAVAFAAMTAMHPHRNEGEREAAAGTPSQR